MSPVTTRATPLLMDVVNNSARGPIPHERATPTLTRGRREPASVVRTLPGVALLAVHAGTAAPPTVGGVLHVDDADHTAEDRSILARHGRASSSAAGLARGAPVAARTTVAHVHLKVRAGAVAAGLPGRAVGDTRSSHARLAGRAGALAGAAIRGIPLRIHARARAQRSATAARASAGHAHRATRAGCAASAAVLAVARGVDAGPPAGRRSGGTDGDALAERAHLTRRARFAAGPTARGIAAQIDAHAAADGPSSIADALSGAADAIARANLTAAAAVQGVDVRVDASACARGLAGRARGGAEPEAAHLAARASNPTAATVRGVIAGRDDASLHPLLPRFGEAPPASSAGSAPPPSASSGNVVIEPQPASVAKKTMAQRRLILSRRTWVFTR